MDQPKPQDAGGGARPKSLDDSVRALAELHRQMVELNARLEYLHLLLKLGVR